MHFLCFLAVLELMSDSLTTIYVEPDQCPSHHAILLTQGRICEIFTKKFWELAILKNGHFEKSAILDFFSQKYNFFFAWSNYVIEWMGFNFGLLIQNGWFFKITVFQNRQFSKFFSERLSYINALCINDYLQHQFIGQYFWMTKVSILEHNISI